MLLPMQRFAFGPISFDFYFAWYEPGRGTSA